MGVEGGESVRWRKGAPASITDRAVLLGRSDQLCGWTVAFWDLPTKYFFEWDGVGREGDREKGGGSTCPQYHPSWILHYGSLGTSLPD